MTINFTNSTIEMTKTESTAASKFGSKAYKQLQEARKDYPTYTIVIKAVSSRRENLKGLTYDYMEKYIAKHDDENHSAMEKYNMLRGNTEDVLADSLTYGEIKKWFLNQFPEIAEFHKKREAIMAA